MVEDLVMFGLYLCSGTKPFAINSEHRIIWFSRDENLAILIRTDTKELKKPKTYPRTAVLDWIREKKLILISKEKVVPQLKLSDQQLEKRYPPRKPKENSNDADEELISAPLKYRRKWLPFVEEVKPFLTDVWRKNRSLSSALEPACKKYDLPLNESYGFSEQPAIFGRAVMKMMKNRRFLTGEHETPGVFPMFPASRTHLAHQRQ